VRKRHGWHLVVLVVILLALIFLAPSYGWELRMWFMPVPPQGGSTADQPGVAAENQALKAELAKLQNVAAQLPKVTVQYIPAIVYSRYPFNFKNEVLVNAGTDQGVAVGKAAVFQGIVIGSVGQAFPGYSLVQTVFDGGFKMPVRVGSGAYDALLVGGVYPKVTSIVKDASLKIGDIVLAAGPGFPYGLPVAVVASTSTSPDGLFEEATLGFAYDMNSIRVLLIAQ
jgi:rod shape-determining protein MreC